jgi:hypothetical protein
MPFSTGRRIAVASFLVLSSSIVAACGSSFNEGNSVGDSSTNDAGSGSDRVSTSDGVASDDGPTSDGIGVSESAADVPPPPEASTGDSGPGTFSCGSGMAVEACVDDAQYCLEVVPMSGSPTFSCRHPSCKIGMNCDCALSDAKLSHVLDTCVLGGGSTPGECRIECDSSITSSDGGKGDGGSGKDGGTFDAAALRASLASPLPRSHPWR